jgi:murein hydrolase activator
MAEEQRALRARVTGDPPSTKADHPSHAFSAISAPRRSLREFFLRVLRVLCALCVSAVAFAQDTAPPTGEAQSRRIADRMRALQREADRLAGETRTLLGDVRKLEIERDQKATLAQEAAAATAQAERDLQQTTDRLARLELQKMAQLPDMKAQLVDMYKRGQSGYARLLLGARNLREFARAARAVGSLTTLNEQRIVEHRRTLEALRTEREAFARKARDVQKKENDARVAKAAADRAVAARTELISQIDARRDLTAQYVGDLQVAYDKIQQQLKARPESGGAESVPVPLLPFRGALEWPVAGRVTTQFGQGAGRLGGAALRNGIEIAATDDASVHAVHGGTVGFADVFTGFGTLVILDHGNSNYSLYGYLSSTSVKQGDRVESGAEVGKVGQAPAGTSALYFEMRIDGKSVDPVQWLKPR